jgi:hypothetical protein
MDNRPSQAFLHALFLYRIPAPSLLLLSVGCCVVSANGGRLKLMPCPSLYFFVTLFAASNDRKKSSQRVPPRSRLITNATPPASAELRLVALYIDKTAATQDLCSALPQFLMCAIGAPQSRDPAAASPSPGAGPHGGSDGLAAATAGADAIVVETVDAEIYTAAAWTPW